MEKKNDTVNQAQTQLKNGFESFKQEITTPVSVTFNLSKTVRIVALIVALVLTYSVVPHWFSFVSSNKITLTGLFAPMNGAFAALAGRMFELLMLKSALAAALYCVAFPTHTILKIQSKFTAKQDSE
jgi:hypothetical protein